MQVQPAGGAHRTMYQAFPCMVANEKQTASLQLQCLNSGPAHHGLGVGHEDDTLVAEGVAEVCQANPSVARSPLNYCPPWSDQTCTHKCAWHINLHYNNIIIIFMNCSTHSNQEYSQVWMFKALYSNTQFHVWNTCTVHVACVWDHVEGNVWCACSVPHSQGRTPAKKR